MKLSTRIHKHLVYAKTLMTSSVFKATLYERRMISYPLGNVFVFQILFVVFMGIVAILLINMLIAMMGNTYQKIAETRNEWQRQVKTYDNLYKAGEY